MKKHLKYILCIVLAFVLSMSFITGCTSNSNENQDKIIINNQYGTYYFTGSNLFKLNDDDTVTPVSEKNAEEDNNVYVSSDYKHYYFDNKIYDFNWADYFCYKFNDDSAELEKTVLINEETLKNSVLSVNGTVIIGGIYKPIALGDFIYFIYYPSNDYFEVCKSKAYRLGRMKTDGSNIEFVNEEIASDYTIYNGWIYFFDNGYTFNTSKSDYEINEERIGFYKMKPDGSEKTLLLNEFRGSEALSKNTYDKTNYCFNINSFDDYIYFVDISDNGESKLYRMKPDGTDVEPVSENGAQNYTVDGNTLYYTTGTNNQAVLDGRTLYSVSLETGKETELFKLSAYPDLTFTIYKDYIYFHDDNRYVANEIRGARYNQIEKTMEYLNFIQETRTTTEGVLGVEKKTLLPPKCYWESVEPTKSSNGQLVY